MKIMKFFEEHSSYEKYLKIIFLNFEKLGSSAYCIYWQPTNVESNEKLLTFCGFQICEKFMHIMTSNRKITPREIHDVCFLRRFITYYAYFE